MKLNEVCKGLQCCISNYNALYCEDDCPYLHFKQCDYEVMKDAYEYLTERLPIKSRQINMGFACGNCNKYIEKYFDYCPWCGRKVAWE